MLKPVLLFDMDGTLTAPRQFITLNMKQILQTMRNYFDLAVVSGSDLSKIKEQLGNNILKEFDYVFAENGLVAYHNGNLIASKSIREHLGKRNIKLFIAYCLEYISKLDIPVKTSNFVELRHGLINVSPIGRNCSMTERDNFAKYDLIHNIRKKMIDNLKCKFKSFNLIYSIGGQISFDVFPKGWDKTYCLDYLKNNIIHFFGDKTEKGGNDYEIFMDPRVIGHAVKSFHDTINELQMLKNDLTII